MPKKRIAALAAALIVLLSATGMFNCYDKLETIAHQENGTNASSYAILYLYNEANLETTVYALKNRLQNSENLSASESLLMISGSEEFKNIAQQVFDDEYFWRWNEHVNEDVNLHYYALDHESQRALWNDESLKNLNFDELNGYQFAIRVTFDAVGSVAVDCRPESSYDWQSLFDDSTKARIESYIFQDSKVQWKELQNQSSSYAQDSEAEKNAIELKPITNMTFIFAIPAKLQKADALYWNSNWMLENSYQTNALVFALAFGVLVFVISLFFPIRVVREWNWFRSCSKIKFEFLLIGLSLAFSLLAAAGISLVMVTQEGILAQGIDHFQLTDYVGILILVINMTVWISYFSLILFCGMMFRHILNKGLFHYLLEDTCLAWIIQHLAAAGRGMGRLLNRIFSYDFKDPIHQILLKLVFVNFLVVCGLCCFFVFGWLLAILYSLLLFFWLHKKLGKIQNDYQILLHAAHQISNGNFNVTIDQEVESFGSLRDAFAELKTGFEKAVNEEVKSQRLKTELISNVSHDLKTPLTSIITYVDLLKKKGVSEEDRNHYLATIDRNAQRLKNLISDLFEISKANSGNVSLHLVDVELISLIRQVELECQEKIEDAHLEFRMNASSEKVILQLDSLKAYRIFENLIINICKYAMPYTRVYVEITEKEKIVQIVFKNISAEEIAVDPSEITERFVQGDRSRNTEGSGLGLAIVKSFTQLHQGSFHVEVDGDLFKAILVFPRCLVQKDKD